MTRFSIFLLCLLIFSCKTAQTPGGEVTASNTQAPVKTDIDDFVSGMERYDGYFTFYYDFKKGKVWLEIDKLNTEFLYVNSLPAGIGSNDIGLDRGQLGDTRVVKFTRSGPKVFLTEPNYGFRAVSDNQEERKSVEQAFATSVIWGFEVAAQSDWNVLIDLTPFLMRDAHGVASRLSQTKQGNYRIDPTRSALFADMIKNFPENSEFESTVTFVGKADGGWIKSVTPTPDAVTVRMHHSFIQLPDSQYQPRVFDPRAGYNFIRYQDYATPIDQPLVKRFIKRHRLVKKDPDAALSEAVEPIVYYLDRGAPEPVKSALMEGALWWNQAFEAAGYQNAFQVKLLPEDADPMDVRYNLIQWVHRSTRGWSYGSSVADPRTGEIIKGHVSLGSLRVRQDFLIAEGLLGPYDTEQVPVDMLEMSLARLRQLSAHEVGHTLGIVHNFAASVNGRSSVMDYPHPYVKLTDGAIDLSEAYDTGIGEWDKQVIKYGYTDFADGVDENDGLNTIIKETFDMGLLHITDVDARPKGGAHPFAHLWDNGANPADELNRMMEIRGKVIANFSDKNIAADMPMSKLEEVFVPMYLFHRYQIEGAAKVVGGLNYSYAIKGDGQVVTEMVDPEMQQRAIEALLGTITPEQLALPENLLAQIPPRAYGFPRTRETFRSRTGVTFDALGIAQTAANMTVTFLLDAQRANRLVEYKSRDNAQPGLGGMIDQMVTASWKSSRESDFLGEVQRVVDKVVLFNLMGLAREEGATEQTRAIATQKIEELNGWIKGRLASEKDVNQQAHLGYASRQINQFFEGIDAPGIQVPLGPPDGSPIGMDYAILEHYCSGH